MAELIECGSRGGPGTLLRLLGGLLGGPGACRGLPAGMWGLLGCFHGGLGGSPGGLRGPEHGNLVKYEGPRGA